MATAHSPSKIETLAGKVSDLYRERKEKYPGKKVDFGQCIYETLDKNNITDAKERVSFFREIIKKFAEWRKKANKTRGTKE